MTDEWLRGLRDEGEMDWGWDSANKREHENVKKFRGRLETLTKSAEHLLRPALAEVVVEHLKGLDKELEAILYEKQPEAKEKQLAALAARDVLLALGATPSTTFDGLWPQLAWRGNASARPVGRRRTMLPAPSAMP